MLVASCIYFSDLVEIGRCSDDYSPSIAWQILTGINSGVAIEFFGYALERASAKYISHLFVSSIYVQCIFAVGEASAVIFWVHSEWISERCLLMVCGQFPQSCHGHLYVLVKLFTFTNYGQHLLLYLFIFLFHQGELMCRIFHWLALLQQSISKPTIQCITL